MVAIESKLLVFLLRADLIVATTIYNHYQKCSLEQIKNLFPCLTIQLPMKAVESSGSSPPSTG